MLDSAPPPSSMLARVISAITQGHDNVKFLSLGREGAALELGKAATILLFQWDEARSDEFGPHLKHLMANQKAKGSLVLGLVGGDDGAWQVLRKAKPMMTQVKVGQIHIDDNGKIQSKNAEPVVKALAGFEQTPHPTEEEWVRLLEENAKSIDDYTKQAETLTDFSEVLAARRPVATWTLASILLAVFGLELVWGGTQSAPVLVRMGALSPERVLDGEIWRLFSCTFLHSGPMHLLFNTYVLWVLGNSLERILGTARFIILYGLSCLGGSLASLVFLQGLSVGASGGLWGLLGAEAVIAWRSQGLIVDSMIPGARRATAINLGINVLNSFRPHVDMWAHFGGGAVGAVLILSGVLTRGLPRLGELAAAGNLADADDLAIPTGTSTLNLARSIAAVLLLGLCLGLAMGQPWNLKRPIEQERVDLPDLGFSLLLPKGLEVTPNPPEDEEIGVMIGDLFSDPGAMAVSVYPGDLTDETLLNQEHAALFEALKEAAPGSRVIAGPEDAVILGKRGITVTYRYENELEEELAFVFLSDALVKVDTVRWPSFGDAVPKGYAAQVLESLEGIQ